MLTYLKQIDKELDLIQQKVDNLMAQFNTVKDLLTAIDAETTRIAAKIDELVAKLQAGGMTEDEEAEVEAALSATADRLKALGHDPTNPIPSPPTV